MKFYKECDLDQFEAWSGGKDTLEVLIDRDDCDSVQQLIEECFGEDDMPSETTINDFLWFDRDTIAQHLGYDDWDAYVNGEEEEDDEDEEEEDEDKHSFIERVYFSVKAAEEDQAEHKFSAIHRLHDRSGDVFGFYLDEGNETIMLLVDDGTDVVYKNLFALDEVDAYEVAKMLENGDYE